MTPLVAALRAPTFPAVRRRVFRQLVESLVYEDALAVRAEADGSSSVEGRTADGAPVRYTFTTVRGHGFDRIRLVGTVLRAAGGTTAEADSPTRFLAEVSGSLTADDACLARFAHELEQTVRNDALARHCAPAVRLADADYDTLECAIGDGHRYHPTYKSRVGFDPDDQLAYGPEFARPIRPLWMASRRSITRLAVSAELDERSFLEGQLGTDTLAAFADAVTASGGDPAHFTYLPVHPWQWREQVAGAFADQLRRGDLVPLGEDPLPFLAQQSIRTLGCPEAPRRPHLKLALSMVNTSTSRVLAPHTVGNAPAVSDWLAGLVAGDRFLTDEAELVVLREVMGTVADPEPAAAFARAETYGTLACIWRESVHTHLRPGERAVPFTGLTARERDGTPLIDPWVRSGGVAEWVSALVRVSVVPLVHLLVRHGVACESHAQNMVLLHRAGRPTRVALKDFHDGVRFSRAHLADPARCPELAAPPGHHVNANSFLETDELGLVTDFLLDAFFFVNLGELGRFLAEHYAFAEAEFWALVRAGIEAHLDRFPELARRFALFDVGKNEVTVEKLTTRRLMPDTELRLHAVPNPLAGTGRA